MVNIPRFVRMTIVATALFGTVNPGSSFAQGGYDRRIRVNNYTSETLRELYASNVGTRVWEEDILGSDIIPAGSSVVVNLYDGSGYCRFDLKAVFSDGAVVIKERVNICEATSWSLYDQ